MSRTVARAVLALRPGASMQLLGDLFVEPQAAYMRCHGYTHLREAGNRWFYQVHLPRFAWTEIDVHRLPGPRFVLHRHFDTHRVGKLHLMNFRLQPEGERVERQLQHVLQPAYPLAAVALKNQVKILGGAGGPGETQLHRYATLKVVTVNHASLHRLLQYAAEREKRNPSAQAFLVEALLASDTARIFSRRSAGFALTRSRAPSHLCWRARAG